mmetsp:Transcript_3871/g.6440  ORF Transcript_3871/g.6440 Transcript_3871/m.6440 type:complete len:620 (+) Transcript_3871:168-2027(+)|eukprot:CAMPEP_0119307428 /NCGR_PEP_ID=MMETSP1333-20130426/7932_1 /TAXON_ID=418940 /ORGANISM="Scyphosphaera apsteinii, Strain RCC1455" /LENGTH=619 /DNA_ID=CAMNT_0007310977 /DNA_START=164 /DNA_END=2023 /DNA_ORIENTATION=-
MVRVSLRRVGGSVIKKAALPATMAELLEVATRKLGLESPAARVFGADGGEFDHDDLELIEKDDLLYFSCGEAFTPPVVASVDPVDVLNQPELLAKMPAEWVLSHKALLFQVLQRHGSTHIVQAATLRAIRQLGAEWLDEHAFGCRSSATLARQSQYGGPAGHCNRECQNECTIVMERLADRDEPDGAWRINAAQVRIAALEVLGAVAARGFSFRYLDRIESVMLNDDHAGVRTAALVALRSFFSAKRIGEWHSPTRKYLPVVLSRLVDTGPGVRLAALELLTTLPASLLQMHAPAIRAHLRGRDWDADEEHEEGDGPEVLDKLKHQRATARKAVLGRLHDSTLFDWLSGDLIALVGRSLRDTPHALALLAGCSQRLHVTLRDQLSAIRAPFAVARRSTDVYNRFPHVNQVRCANFCDQVFSEGDCSLLALAFPCLTSLNALRFIRVSFHIAALPALLTSMVGVAEETGLASRLESLTLHKCQFPTNNPLGQAQAMAALAQTISLFTGLRYLDLEGSGQATEVINACDRVNKERLELAACHEDRNACTSQLRDRWYTPSWSWIWRCSSCNSPRVLSQSGSELSCSGSKVSCTTISVRDEVTQTDYGGIQLCCDDQDDEGE